MSRTRGGKRTGTEAAGLGARSEATRPPPDVFQAVAGLAARTLDARAAVLRIGNRTWRSGPSSEASLASASESLAETVVRSGVPLSVQDARERHATKSDGGDEALAFAFAGAPVSGSPGETRGSLSVLDHAPRAWTRAELSLLEDLAAMAGASAALEDAHAREREENERRALALERRRRAFRLLRDLGSRVTGAVRLEQALGMGLETVCAFTGWPVGHVYLWSPEKERLVPTDIWVVAPDVRVEKLRSVTMETTFRLGEGLPGRAALENEPEWIADLSRDPNFVRARLAEDLGIGAGFAFPIASGGAPVAVLECFAPETQQPDELALELVEHASTLLGRTADRVRAEQQEREREAWVRGVLDTVHEAFVSMDSIGRIREWNPEAERTFGFRREEVLGEPVAEVLIPERFREAHRAGLARYLETGNERVLGKRLELSALHRDGGEVDVELTISALSWRGETVFNAFLHDISDRKRAELELRRQRRQLEDSQRLAHIGSWQWDVGTNSVTWSDELYRIYGLTPESFAATFEGYLQLVHEEDRQRVQETVRSALESAQGFEFDERVVRPDGEVRHLQSYGIVERDDEGRPVRLIGVCHDVTELRKAAARAEAATSQLKLILDSVDEGIFFLDRDGTVTFANRAAAEMCGVRSSKLLGERFHELAHAGGAEDGGHAPEACPGHTTCRDGRRRRVDTDDFRRRDGTSFPVSYSAIPASDARGTLLGAVLSFRDLTKQRAAEDETRRALYELVREQAARAEADASRERLHRVFEQVPALVAMTAGPEHVFEMVNPRMSAFLGGRELLGKPFAAALPELAGQGFAQLLDRVYRSREPYVGKEVAVRFTRGTEEELQEGHFDFVYQPVVQDGGGTSGILIHAVEVTEQVRARRQLEEKARELVRLAAELERRNRDLDQFAYAASHDLKAPLRGIGNLSDWIAEDLGEDIPDEVAENVALLRDRVQRMAALIDGLLQYSRATRGRGSVQEVNLHELVTEVVEFVAPPEHLAFEVDEGLPVLRAEKIALRQVLQNLISNAARFAHHRVGIGGRLQDEFCEIWVKDDGPGIAPEYQEKIWTIFQTLESRDEGGGTGIGLSIVKRIVEDQGGWVWVESEEGRGAEFRFLWPRSPRQE